jgi:O-antigen ligase
MRAVATPRRLRSEPARSALVAGVGLACSLALAFALVQAPPRARAAVVLAAVAAGVVVPLVRETSLAAAGRVLLGAAFVVVAWNGVKVGGHSALYLALVPAAALLLAQAIVVERRVVLPRWLWAAGGGIAFAAALASLFPPSASYLAGRYVHVSALVRYGGRSVPHSNVGNLAKFELCLLAIPFLVLVAGRSGPALRRLADLWVLSGVASAAVATTDLLKLTHVSSHQLGIPTLGRQAGLTVQPNHLAMMSAMALPLAALWWLRSPAWRAACAVALPLLVVGVYASGSRGGLVAGALALAAVAFGVPELRRAGVRLLVVAAVVALAWSRHFVHGLASIAGRGRLLGGSGASGATSDHQRHELLLQARADIAHSPIFGLGPRVVNEAHDIYLQLLASGGAIGLAAFLVFLVGVAHAARTGLRLDRQLALACAAAVGTWLVTGFVENQLVEPYLYVPAALLVALATLAEPR